MDDPVNTSDFFNTFKKLVNCFKSKTVTERTTFYVKSQNTSVGYTKLTPLFIQPSTGLVSVLC